MKFSNNLIIGLCTTIALAVSSSANAGSTEETVNVFGIDFEKSASLSQTQYLEKTQDNSDIRLAIVKFKTNEEARMFMDDRLAQFQSVFQPKRVDYPGQYSKSIECSDNFKPTLRKRDLNRGNFSYFDGYANQNKVAGACSKDLIKYRFIYGVVICSNPPRVMEIEEYLGIDNDNKTLLLDQVTCDF